MEASHHAFILAAYVTTALVIGLLILRAVIDHRRQRRALNVLEARDEERDRA